MPADPSGVDPLNAVDPSALPPSFLPPVEPSALMTLGRAWLPIPVLIVLAPIIHRVFASTWRELDDESRLEREKMAAQGDIDRRVPVALVVTAAVLTMLEYYGGRTTYGTVILPALLRRQAAGELGWMHLEMFEELYGFVYWTLSHITGYVVIPLTVWRLMFRGDSVLDLGLRTRGFFKHLWIYGLCIAVVIPCLLIVSREPDFGTYYPFYSLAGRSWFDLVTWELIYGAQFFALEMFFRGWLLGALRRSLGSGAIFAMAAPYCMIHFGKPYLEAFGAIVAGVVLGSLSMRTKSIYAGFLVHVTVAVSMDLVALSHRDALPIDLVPW